MEEDNMTNNTKDTPPPPSPFTLAWKMYQGILLPHEHPEKNRGKKLRYDQKFKHYPP